MRTTAGCLNRTIAFAGACAFAAIAQAHTTQPTGFTCIGAPTTEAINLKWDPAPRLGDNKSPAWTFKLFASSAGVLLDRADASSYVIKPSNFKSGKIPADVVNFEVQLQRVGLDGRTGAVSRLYIFVPDKMQKPAFCK